MNLQASAQAAPQVSIVPRTPSLPEAKPEALGLSRPRLQAMSDAFKREIDKGTGAVARLAGSRRSAGHSK
jgi:hypothetical protein